MMYHGEDTFFGEFRIYNVPSVVPIRYAQIRLDLVHEDAWTDVSQLSIAFAYGFPIAIPNISDLNDEAANKSALVHSPTGIRNQWRFIWWI